MEANPAVALLLALGIIIAASRIGGGIARQLKQPRVLGELIVGVLLGPTLLNFLHWGVFHGVELEATIAELAELGVVMLMFIIGLEVDLEELRRVGRVGMIAGLLGTLVPVAMAYPLMALSGYGWQPALFTGVTLAATSVSISAQVLFELGVLQSREGNALLATALIDDILAILLVSVTIALAAAGNTAGNADAAVISPLAVVVQMTAYLVLASLIAWFIVPHVVNWLGSIPSISQSHGIPALALITLLIFAWSAQAIGGVATITGSFIAGVGLSQSREHIKHTIEDSANAIAYVFLVPIFFIDVGLRADMSNFPLSALPLATMLLIVAIVSKIGGCGLGALAGSFNRQEALRLGVCMISRGEVGLIVASLGLSAGVFERSSPLFASLFLVILLSTLITPILVRMVFSPTREAPSTATHS